MDHSATATLTQRSGATGDAEARLAAAADILSYAILAGGAVTIALAVYVTVLGHSRLPFWDEWMQIDFAANEGPAHTFDWLWRQFNQHRVVIPKLFLLADLRWFRATQTFLLAVNLVLQFLHLCVLAWSLRVLGGWRGALWRTAVGLLAFCLFCPSQLPNLVMGFTGLCCYLPPLFASVSFLGLLLYWRDSRENSSRAHSWKYLALSVVAALCATYSLSNGNLVWPLLVIGAVLLRVRFTAIAGIVAVAAVGIFAFFYNYTVYLTSAAVRTPAEVLGLIRYIAVYFGSSWVTANIRAAEILGVAGFLILAFTLLQMPAYFKVAPAVCIQIGLLLLFVLGTGIVTAPGRVVFGIDQAFSGRYQSFSLLFWGCMALLLLGSFVSSRPQSGLFVAAEIGVLAVMLFAAQKTQPLLLKARWHGFNVNLAAIALETGVPDNAQLAWAHSHPDYPRSLIPFMRDQRLSVFTERGPDLLGRSLDAEFTRQDPDRCVGKVEATTAITSAWPQSFRISGWAWDLQRQAAPSEILIVSDGVITGLGLVGDQRPSMDVRGQTTSQFTGFAAYVADVSRPSKLEIYAVPGRGGKSACYIASVAVE